MLREYSEDLEYYTSLPTKKIGACGLVYYKNDLLIVQPSYRPEWLLPCGVVESEESPTEGLLRTLKQDLHLNVQPQKLISVDYIPNQGPQGEYIQFMFATKPLQEIDIQLIEINYYNLNDFLFVSPERAFQFLTPMAALRLKNSLQAVSNPQYLENGRPLF